MNVYYDDTISYTKYQAAVQFCGTVLLFFEIYKNCTKTPCARSPVRLNFVGWHIHLLVLSTEIASRHLSGV